MNRRLVPISLSTFPEVLHPLLRDTPVYDSSCSKEASVWFLDREDGLYLKTAPAGQLAQEAVMTRFFHKKGLAPEVLDYFTDTRDWLLTRRIPGEDCTFPGYLEQPRRLCDTLAHQLRSLHDMPFSGCPAVDRTGDYLRLVTESRKRKFYNGGLFPAQDWGFSSSDEAWQVVTRSAHLLQKDTLIHGDYCLPNIMLDNWQFSGFLDLGGAGIGDRHFDLFWGVWTLFFNLKTNAYYQRFLDAYGREAVEPELLRTVAALEVFL